MLTREQILEMKDVKTQRVEVPEWGGEIYVKEMTGEERDAFESSMVKDGKSNMENIRARLCAICICDEHGHRLFTDKDMGPLGRKSSKALSRIFIIAQKVNGIGTSEVEEMVKNSEEEG